MDKFILNVEHKASESEIIRIDGEAARLLYDLMGRSGASKKHIVSEMIKFCHPRTEIMHNGVKINGGDCNG